MRSRFAAFAVWGSLAGCGPSEGAPADARQAAPARPSSVAVSPSGAAAAPPPGAAAAPPVRSAPAADAAPAPPRGDAVDLGTPAPTKKVSKAAKPLDTADWKGSAAGSTLAVRWTVDQTKAKPPLKPGLGDDLTKHVVPLELTLTLDGHAYSVSLEANAAPAYVNPDTCESVSFFYACMNLNFALERAEGGRVVLTHTRTLEFSSTRARQLYAFEVPAAVKVVQEIVTVAPDGKRTSETCWRAGRL